MAIVVAIAGVLVLGSINWIFPRSGASPFALPIVAAGQLRFADDFVSASIDADKWNTYITSAASAGKPWNGNGTGGSGPESPGHVVNLEYDLPSQVSLGDGLVITASHDKTQGVLGDELKAYAWRSGAVSTYGKYTFDGGYVEIVAKVPTGSGFWPSFWLLPAQGTRRDDFEIDLFEGGYLTRGAPADQGYAWALHAPTSSARGVVNTGEDLSQGWHVFGLYWVPGKSVSWYLDSRLIAEVTSDQIAIPDEAMELIMSLQVAADNTGAYHQITSAATPSSAQMHVRSVRVYR